MKITLSLPLSALLWAALLTGCSADAKKERWLRRADQDFNAGEYDKAKIDYLKVIQLDSKNAPAFARLGAIWLDEGAPLRAGPYLKRAEELAPQDASNRLRLARVYQTFGHPDDARKELVTILEQSPSNGEALVLLTELARKPEEIRDAEQALQKFPTKDGASYHLAAANLAMRKQDFPAAQAAVKQAVAAAPKSPEAHTASGILNLLLKHPEQAGQDFKTASELAPSRSNIQIIYAEYQRQTAGVEAATKTLKNLTKAAPDFLPAWILLARMAASEKKYDEALQLLENVFSRDERNVDARVAQSDFWLAKGEPAKAIEELERIDKAFPGIPTVQYRLAQGYLQQNNAAQAATALDQALAKNPDYTEAILLRAQLNVRTGHLPPAITALENLLKKQPTLKQAQLLLADAYRDSGQLDAAAAIFSGQIKADPTAAQPYLFLGLIQQQQKKTTEARQSFEKVLEVDPDNGQAVNQLVALDLEAKDFDSANRRVQHQMEKHPGDAAPYLLQSKVRMAQQQWKEAEASAKKALELKPDEAAAYEMLVSIYLATNRLPEAVRELETVVSKAPKNASALMVLALTQEKQKDFPKARDAYEKLLEIKPDFVPALNNLSYIYAEHLNQLDKANELARKARSVAPADPSVADTLGWVLFKRADYQQALTLLQESADKVPDNPEIKFHLGMAHYMMGQADAARTAFQQALAATGDFPSKAEAQNRLALLGDAAAPAGQMTVSQLEDILAKQPNDLVARIRLAEAYEKQGAWTKATDAYEAALKLNPKLASAALKLAQLFSGPAANKEKALTYAKTARALSPQDPKTTGVLGRVAFATGDFAWAYSLLQESARQLTSDPIILHDLAWAAYSLGKVDEARKAMQGALAATPAPETAKDAHLFLDLTAASAESPTANAEIDSTLKSDPKYVPALMAAGLRDLKNGNKSPAVARFTEVLREFPDFAPAQFQLATLYADDPSHETEAYDLAAKARKSLPEDPAVAQLLGQLSYRKKEYPRAAQLLEESASKRPLDGQGLYYLGVTYKEQKDPAKAQKLLTEAVARGLPAHIKAEAERVLAELARPKSK